MLLPASHPPVAEPTVSVRILRSLAACADRIGVPPARLLETTGIAAADLALDDYRIARSTLDALFERAIDLTGDPALGLHWLEQGIQGLNFAPVSPLVAHAATLGQALEHLRRYGRLLSDRPGSELVELGDRVALRWLGVPNASPRAQRFAAESTMFGHYRMCRGFAPDAPPPRVSFAYPAPDYHAEYARLFGGNAHFDQPHTEVVLDRTLLEARSPHQDDDMHDALRTVADRRIVRLSTRAPYALRVRELLLKEGAHRTDMKDIARHLGLSVRSLRRRLGDEGKSYNEVALEALALTAKRHLRDQQLSIQETAYEMGFSDTSTFHRAFKRWTGMTPSAYREGGSRSAR